ncbi:MAG TPA: hypothetical protein ENO05_02900 [Bacteroides sp.]|nr:hypothetical protein [Bacteroides sp.]
MKRLLMVCTGLLVFIGMCAQSDTLFFVSSFGSDTNPGTKEAPFLTLQKAAEAVEQLAKKDVDNIRVFIRGGTYALESPLVIDQSVAGKKDGRIIFQAYGEEQPVISGGIQITGWEPHVGGIWKAPAKGLVFRQLYVNDRRAIRCRQPNPGAYYRLKAWDLPGRRIVIRSDQISRWENFEKVEMVLQQFWAESYLRLKSFSLYGTSGGVDAYVTIQDEERGILFPRPYPAKEHGQVFHFENAYAFLDMPGEWYLDLSSDTVYYKPRSYEDMEYVRVTAPRTVTLLLVQGTPEHPVRNLVFQGITFAHSTWTYPGEHGYLNMQAGQFNLSADSLNNQYIGRPPAAITVMNAENVQFHRNTFRHLGAVGLDMVSGTSRCLITGNIIRDIAGSGISVGKFTMNEETEAHVPYDPENKQEICTNDIIRNNVIFRTGCDYYGTSAIVAGYPAGMKIEHNIIQDIPYSGISVGYGWTQAPNAMRDNRIANNRISGVVNMMADGAAIYTLSMQPGTIISGNHIYGIKRSDWAQDAPVTGIFLDEATSGTGEKLFILRNNLIEASNFSRYNFHAIGLVVLDNNYDYSHQIGATEVKDHAGLEPAYMDLESTLGKNDLPVCKTKDIVMMTEFRDEAEAVQKYECHQSAEGVWPVVVHAASGNRMTVWDEWMKTFMQPPPGAEKGATWVPMERIHDYQNGVVR